MFRLSRLALRREGLKLVLAGIPEDWHRKLKILGMFRIMVEVSIVVLGFYSHFAPADFEFPYLTVVLGILIFFELGRPDIEFKYNTSYLSEGKTPDEDGTVTFEAGHSLTTFKYHYLDGDGNRISKEEVGIHSSEHLELFIPPGFTDDPDDDIKLASISLPHPVRCLTIKRETEVELQDRTSVD